MASSPPVRAPERPEGGRMATWFRHRHRASDVLQTGARLLGDVEASPSSAEEVWLAGLPPIVAPGGRLPRARSRRLTSLTKDFEIVCPTKARAASYGPAPCAAPAAATVAHPERFPVVAAGAKQPQTEPSPGGKHRPSRDRAQNEPQPEHRPSRDRAQTEPQPSPRLVVAYAGDLAGASRGTASRAKAALLPLSTARQQDAAPGGSTALAMSTPPTSPATSPKRTATPSGNCWEFSASNSSSSPRTTATTAARRRPQLIEQPDDEPDDDRDGSPTAATTASSDCGEHQHTACEGDVKSAALLDTDAPFIHPEDRRPSYGTETLTDFVGTLGEVRSLRRNGTKLDIYKIMYAIHKRREQGSPTAATTASSDCGVHQHTACEGNVKSAALLEIDAPFTHPDAVLVNTRQDWRQWQ